MPVPVTGYSPVSPLVTPSAPSGGATAAGGVSFQDLLVDSLRQTSALQQQAETAVEAGLIGGDISQVEVFTAVKKADLAMRMMLQVRNKLVEAYQELQQMRM